VALKATTSSKGKNNKKEEGSSEDENSSLNDEDEEMSLFVLHFGKFTKNKVCGARRRQSCSKIKE
jgi:hypothetical protein